MKQPTAPPWVRAATPWGGAVGRPLFGAVPRDDLSRADLDRHQAEALAALLAEVLPRHCFYSRKFASAGLRPDELSFPRDLTPLPFTTKPELLASPAAHPPYGEV